MRDQAAMVRETCKWEFELRFPEQLQELMDRSYAIANSTPKGPTYMSLPRETLCETIEASNLEAPGTITPARLLPDSAKI
mgnify:CR=1 FL=1